MHRPVYTLRKGETISAVFGHRWLGRLKLLISTTCAPARRRAVVIFLRTAAVFVRVCGHKIRNHVYGVRCTGR